MERWVVMLGGESPELYGLFGTDAAAYRAADKWNATHPNDPDGASVLPLNRARDLANAE
jgi:hypothetical protein